MKSRGWLCVLLALILALGGLTAFAEETMVSGEMAMAALETEAVEAPVEEVEAVLGEEEAEALLNMPQDQDLPAEGDQPMSVETDVLPPEAPQEEAPQAEAAGPLQALTLPGSLTIGLKEKLTLAPAATPMSIPITVTAMISDGSLPNLGSCRLASSVFMLVFAIPLGIYTAVKQNTWFDYLVRGLTFAGVSVPNFWMGLVLLWIFALQLGFFPIVGGSVTVENLILPMLTLGIVMTSKYTRQVRATVLEELNQDYVVGARARGMKDSYILWKEVLPNALLPLITLFGLAFGSLLGGAAVVEIVFSWPGLGYTVVQAIIYRDFQTVQAIVLWIALMYMVINLVVDLSYVHLDPRLRKAGR